MFRYIKNKIRKLLEERFVLGSYVLAILLLFIVNVAYNIGIKIGEILNLVLM